MSLTATPSNDESESFVINETSRWFTGAEYLCQALASAGVTHVFGGHGGAVVPLVDAIVAHPSLTWVYCRCETNASQAAAAHAKLNRTLGCCVATSGPGAAHLLSGLIDADQDRVPLLCLTGMKALGNTRHSDFQDIDQSSIFRMAGLCLSETVSDIDQLLPLARNAFTAAVAANRCAHLAIPINVQCEVIEARTHFCLGTAFQSRLCTPASDLQIEALATALRTEILSKRHVLIACGYRAAGVGALVEQIAELLHAPILTSFDGKGAVNEHHPLAYGVVGVYGNAGTPASVDLLEHCDTVVGVCVNDWTELITDKSGLQVRKFIQIDERLVAGDGMRFSPSSVFSCGYLEESLHRVVEALKKRLLRSREKHLTARVSTIGALPNIATTLEPESAKDVWSELKKYSYVKPTGTPSTFLDGKGYTDSQDISSQMHCHPAVFFKIMSGLLDKNSIICADIGDNSLFMASALAAKRGQRYLTSEHLGIMGYSLNAGLAASLSSGGKTSVDGNGDKVVKTLVVAGDGGIQMSINELATMRDHGASNVLVVVIVNSRLGRVQNESWGPGLNADGCHIGSPSFVDLFNAYGYPNGMVLSTCDNEVIAATIEKGWQSAGKHGCCVIEVHQDPLTHPIMHKVPQRQSLSKKPWGEDISHGSLFPSLNVNNWKCNKPQIEQWLKSLKEVTTSDSFWLDKGDIFSISPSEVIQTMFQSLSVTPGETPLHFFNNSEASKAFDLEFKATVLNALPAKVLLEEVVGKGTSNSHPLKMQFLVCPPNFNFKLHSHPNLELIIPLIGGLWEKYLSGATLHPSLLARKSPLSVPDEEDKLYIPPSGREIAEVKESLNALLAVKVASLGSKGKFIDRSFEEGQVLYNEVGSIHQSYTKDQGSLLLVLWSGIHADLDCDCCTGIAGNENLFLPS